MVINGEKILVLGTQIVRECSELMRQLVGINGETFLAGSDLSPIFSKFLHNPNKCLTFAAQEPAKPLNDA